MTSIKNLSITGYFAFFAMSISLFVLSACQGGPPKNTRAAQAEKGKKFFMENCAVCHGPNADQSVVAALEVPPPDLTKIMKRRNYPPEFPVVEIASFIDGRKDVKMHKRDMPAWGNYFAEEKKLSENEIRGKMGELIAYLMSIQK